MGGQETPKFAADLIVLGKSGTRHKIAKVTNQGKGGACHFEPYAPVTLDDVRKKIAPLAVKAYLNLTEDKSPPGVNREALYECNPMIGLDYLVLHLLAPTPKREKTRSTRVRLPRKSKDEFSVGDRVVFGRARGEKTIGIVRKKMRKNLKVEILEARGRYRKGTRFTVPPSMCELA
jgi:hypothetical protein